jgi:hypothetical protein
MPYVAGLPAKQIELFRKVVPKAAKIGLLADLYDPKAGPQRDEMNAGGDETGSRRRCPLTRADEVIE